MILLGYNLDTRKRQNQAKSGELRQLFLLLNVRREQFVARYDSINQDSNDTLRARARAAVGIAHLRLVKSVVVEVD